MKCSETILSVYADGELGRLQSVVLRMHLHRCQDCQEELRRLRLLCAETTQALSKVGETPDIASMVMGDLPGAIHMPPHRGWIPAAVALAGAAALALLIWRLYPTPQAGVTSVNRPAALPTIIAQKERPTTPQAQHRKSAESSRSKPERPAPPRKGPSSRNGLGGKSTGTTLASAPGSRNEPETSIPVTTVSCVMLIDGSSVRVERRISQISPSADAAISERPPLPVTQRI